MTTDNKRLLPSPYDTKRLTPLHLQLLLHYFSVVTVYPCPSPAADEYTRDLCELGLIQQTKLLPSGYSATDKGQALVERLKVFAYEQATGQTEPLDKPEREIAPSEYLVTGSVTPNPRPCVRYHSLQRATQAAEAVLTNEGSRQPAAYVWGVVRIVRHKVLPVEVVDVAPAREEVES